MGLFNRAKPMHIFCKLIGVAPYYFYPNSTIDEKFKTSKFGLIYSLIIASFLMYFAIFNFQTMYTHLNSESYVTIGAQWLQFYINNGFSVIIIIVNSLQQWKIIKVFNKVFSANNNPLEIMENGEFDRDIIYGITIVFLTIFLHLITTLTSYFDNEKRIDYYWFPYGILFLLNTLVLLQFLCCVVKIGMKFKALNLRIEDFISQRMQKYKINIESIDLQINKTADEHLKLIGETNLLISAFSYQLLLCFLGALTISVSGLYLICKRIIQYIVDSTKISYEYREKNYDWWCLSCYPLLHSILLGFIIAVCNWTMNQSYLLDETLPRLQRSFRLSDNSIINCFCQQILLKRVSFHVFHLFKINPSIVCSIISTVLTYLIILVQFEISQDIGSTLHDDPFNSYDMDPEDSYQLVSHASNYSN